MKNSRLSLFITAALLLSGCNNPSGGPSSSDSAATSSDSVATSSDSVAASIFDSISIPESDPSSFPSSLESAEPARYAVALKEGSGCEAYGLQNDYAPGDEVCFSLRVINLGMEVQSVKANGQTLFAEDGGLYRFTMPAENVTLEVFLQEKAKEFATRFNVVYDLGTRKTAKKLESADEIFHCLSKVGENESLISSLEGFDFVYGGANGRNESTWHCGNILKLGTTSVDGWLSLSLNAPVKGVKVVGYTYSASSKIRLGDSKSTSWDGEDDGKTALASCSSMTEICKSAVDECKTSSFEAKFAPTESFRIGTTNKNPLFITALEFVLAEKDNPRPSDKYTVTWKNYDGSILEVDEGVEQGVFPHYDGATPSKPSEGDVSYRFAGWDPEIEEVHQDATYIAKFKEISQTDPELKDAPTLSSDGEGVQYGYYPQTRISDAALIDRLQTEAEETSGGWSFLDGELYASINAEVYRNESYVFDDGNPISSGELYWFRCERISWRVLSQNDGEYLLLSASLLDSGCFYKDYENRIASGNEILPNSYAYSDARAWLNGSFLKSAFAYGSSYLLPLDSSEDKAGLLSQEDCLNPEYGFAPESGASPTRTAKTTDFARARGAWYNKGDKNSSLLFCGSYWTSSPSGDFDYAAKNVNSSGFLSDYAVDGESHCYRPIIKIRL